MRESSTTSSGKAGLQILLFGPGEIWSRDGITRRLSTQPKAFALLARLAMCRNTEFVRRDSLLSLLWPELDTARGRNALSQALHRLRRDLGSDVLVTRGQEEIALAMEVWCDIRRFREALELDDLPAALALFRGPLLDGFHVSNPGAFEHWLDIQRHETRQAALRVALSLAAREEAASRSPEACAWLRRAVEIAPADEETLRRLIQALYQAGDRSGAIRAYETAASRLWVELEMEPGEETRALVDSVRGLPAESNPEARRARLRGRYMTSIPGLAGKGFASLEQAVALAPDSAAAHAALAEGLAVLAVHGLLSRDQAADRLASSARRAIELDPELGDPYVALGVGRFVFSRDWDGAEHAFRRAVELDPASARAHAHLAFFLSNMGWLDEGVAESACAARLDPLDPFVNFMHGFALYRARRYEAALEQFRALVELQPHHAHAFMFMAENELRLGRVDLAIHAALTAATLQPEDPLLTGISACVLGFAGDESNARLLLRRLHESARHRYVNPHFLAAAHAGLGELGGAFDYWQRMIEDNAPGAFMLPGDPLFDPLRSDRRFQSLIERLRLPGTGARGSRDHPARGDRPAAI